MVDARDLKSLGVRPVRVRFPPQALSLTNLFSLGKPRPLGGVRVLRPCLKNVLEIMRFLYLLLLSIIINNQILTGSWILEAGYFLLASENIIHILLSYFSNNTQHFGVENYNRMV